MRAGSHKIFNASIAANVMMAFHTQKFLETLIIALGIFFFSSFPDKIEDVFKLKHRGKSHALELYTIVAIFCWIGFVFYSSLYWLWVVLFGAIGGSVLHIIADMFSVRGIDVMGQKIIFRLYSTGTQSESVFLWSFVALNALIFFR